MICCALSVLPWLTAGSLGCVCAGLGNFTVMANAVVASWAACIKELQRLVDAPSVAQSDGNAVLKLVEQLDNQPPLPHAACKRLVQDLQVNRAGMDAEHNA